MNCTVPGYMAERINRAGGLNRYGEPNFMLAWSQAEKIRSGGVWPQDHYAGYRDVYVANGSPYPPQDGYWMLMEWDPPEMFGSETLWWYLHRDETTGLAMLGPYPHKGRYKIALKLIWTSIDEGVMTIEPMALNSSLVDMIIPVVIAGRKDSPQRRKAFAVAEKAMAERRLNSSIESLMNSAKRPLLLPSQIDDRIRLMEKQWSSFLKNPRKLNRGIQMIPQETVCR